MDASRTKWTIFAGTNRIRGPILKRNFQPHPTMANPRTLFISLVSATAGVLVTLAVTSLLDGSRSGDENEADSPVTLVLDDSGTPNADQGDITLAFNDPRISMRQLGKIGEKMALADPEAAVKRALEIPGHDNREAYLGSVLRTWGEKDGETAALWARDFFKGEQLTDALYYIGDGWAEADPEGAATWFNENTEGTVLDDAMWEALESWGRKDPAAAFAWTANLDDYLKSNVMQGLAEGWGAVDPEGAIRAGMEMGSADYAAEFVTSVMTQWAGSDPEKAASWALTVVNERLRAGVLNELGETWAQTEPEKAAEWIRSIEDPGNRRFAENGLAIGWSEHDPGGAINWALDSGTEQVHVDEMISDIIFNWANLDPRGAVKWLREQPPGPRSDSVLRAFTAEIADDDPRAAVVWASEINDPALRASHLRDMMQSWVELYGDRAREEIQALDLPAELKAEFTTPPAPAN